MKKNFYIIYILLFSLILSNSRVSFTRPGSFLRLSDHAIYNNNELLSIAIASEITSLGDIVSHASSFAINKNNPTGMSWGLSYTMLPYTGINALESDVDIDYEFGVHMQSTLYRSGKTYITAGLHDFLLGADDLEK